MFQGQASPLRNGPAVSQVTARALLRRILNLGAGLIIACAATFPAHGFSSAPYLPLADGNQWTYQKNGGASYYNQILSTQFVNGYPTKALYDSEDGSTSYYSNDANGIRQHRIYTPSVFVDGCGYSSETADFSPPIVIATPDVTVGQVINSSGNLPVSLPGCGFTDLYTYQASSSIVGLEFVTVPRGIFYALRVQLNASIYYQGVFQFSSSETHWVSPNVGAIQSTYTESGITDTYKLTATNVVRTAPDAFSFTAQSGVALNSTVTSNTITVTGTTAASPISITGGQFSINGGAFTSAAGTVSNGQTVAVRQTSSASPSSTTNATLTIGGVSAVFSVTTVSIPSYALTVQVTGSGTVTSNPAGIDCGATCLASFAQGTMVTLTAMPGLAGYVGSFSGGGCSGTITCTVTMDAAKTVSVNFIPNTLTINKVGSGTVTWSQTAPVATFVCGDTCSRNIRQGDTVTLTATADSGYAFSGWSGGGCSGTGSCTVVMNSPTTVTATFTLTSEPLPQGPPPVVTPPPVTSDTQAPTVPTGLTATAVSSSQINLSWGTATDTVAVTLYQVFRNGVLRASVNAPMTSFSDTGLTASTLYSYTVAACDAAGNCSAQSASISATTATAGSRTNATLIDQQQSVIDTSVGGAAIGGGSQQKLAQVITAGISGVLAEVRFPVACTSGDLVVEVQGVTGGIPNGVVLTFQSIPGGSLPSFFPTPGVVSFRGLVFSAPVFFSAGSQFAIVLSSSGECGVFRGPTGNSYPGGNAFFDARPNPVGVWVCICDFAGDRFDLPFQTLVDPETFIPQLKPGFNLIGNSLNITLNVPATFGNQDALVPGITSNVVTIWKWVVVEGTGRWAFYSPQLTAAGIASFAASKGYDVLATINPGEGYWVNAATQMTLPAQTGTGYNWNGINFAALPTGFNLIAHANSRTPSQFNNDVNPTPPAVGEVPTGNFLTLWAWDAAAANWYFYSPLLESSGGLPAVKAYADSKFYRHFQDFNKMLGLGAGFWVNRP